MSLAQESAEESDGSALGARRGGFLFYPSLELRTGYSDNLDMAPDPVRSGSLSEVLPALTVRSDWSRHSVSLDLKGTLTAHDGDWDAGEQAAEASLTAQIDLYRDSSLTLTGGYSYAASPGIRDQQYDGGLAYAHTFNRLTVTLSGGIAFYDYGGDHSGETSSTEAEVSDYRETSGRVRMSYELSPLTSVFAEAGVNRRIHSQPIDSNGYLRGSDGYDAAVGLSWSNGSKLSGELAVGYQSQNPRDPALAPVRGVTVDGELSWQATALTRLTVGAGTEAGETTLAGSGGYIRRSAELSVEHALRRNITLYGGVAVDRADFSGVALSEETVEAQVGLEYLLNPHLAVSAEAVHTRFDSTQAGADYTANSFMVGLKAQR